MKSFVKGLQSLIQSQTVHKAIGKFLNDAFTNGKKCQNSALRKHGNNKWIEQMVTNVTPRVLIEPLSESSGPVQSTQITVFEQTVKRFSSYHSIIILN